MTIHKGVIDWTSNLRHFAMESSCAPWLSMVGATPKLASVR